MTSQPLHVCSKAIALVGGDLLAIAIFAAIGRGSHGRSLDPVSVLSTAAPFLIGINDYIPPPPLSPPTDPTETQDEN